MKLLRIFLGLALILGVALLPAVGFGDTNVALGKTVTLSGTSGGVASLVVDGNFMSRGTQWQIGSVWWYGTAAFVDIDLGASYNITSFIVQADDNDSYRVSYWHNDNWVSAWEVPNYDAYGWGLQTRPNPDNNSERYFLPTVRGTDKLRFTATGGDGSYSVSELQAYGAPVPLPGAVWLLGSGLLGLAGWRRFRKG